MIATVTPNPAVDYTVSLSATPTDGEILRTDRTRYDAGGKGINVAKYLDAVGSTTVATGFLGGFVGEYLESRLSIPAEFVTVDGTTRLNTTLLAPDTEYKINQVGPTIDASAVDSLIESLAVHEPNMIVIAGSLPPGIGPKTIDRIAAAGEWETAVDLGGAVLCELSAEYHLCKPNRAELAEAIGKPVDSVERAIEAAESLREQGFSRVVASLGSAGALSVTDEHVHYAPPLDVDVVDTVGAGDALLSGVLDGIDRGASSEDALRTGMAVAACVVSAPGTRVPPPNEVATARERVSVVSR